MYNYINKFLTNGTLMDANERFFVRLSVCCGQTLFHSLKKNYCLQNFFLLRIKILMKLKYCKKNRVHSL